MNSIKLGRLCIQLQQRTKFNQRCLLFSDRPFYEIKNGRSSLTQDFLSASNNESASIASKKFESISQNIKSEINNDDYLTKLLAHIANDINDKNRVYKNDLKNAIEKISNRSFVHQREGILLLRCCSNMLPDEKPSNRMKLLNSVWDILLKNSTIGIDHYHELLRCYIDNEHKFSTYDFIQNMSPIKPTEVTYKLLLHATCQMGNMNQAMEIIENMKSSKIPLTENHFNYLIEGYGIKGDMTSALKVFDDLKSYHIDPTVETKKSLIKAYACNGDLDQVKNHLSLLNQDTLKDEQVLDIVQCFLKNKMESLLPDCLALLPKTTLTTPNTSTYLHSFCTQMIHQGHYITAYDIYNYLPANDFSKLFNFSTYARVLIRECIKSNVSFDDITHIIDGLIKSERYPFAGYAAVEACIHFNKFEFSVEILKFLKTINQPIRNHFFWPLFIAASKTSGESGIFEIISIMKSLDLTLNHETLVDYILPHVNIVSPENLLKKFQKHGFSATMCITSIMHHLLKNKDARSASELCELSEGQVDCEQLIFPLMLTYLSNEDVDSVHNILKAFQEKPKFKKDWIGNFLVTLISYRKWKVDVKYFNNILRVLLESNTKISSQAIEACMKALDKYDEYQVSIEEIKHNLELMRNLDTYDQSLGNIKESNQFMNIKELEMHLIELESKEMNTRGVLRKLLQLYCRYNDVENAKLTLEKCKIEKVEFSAGMKASIMDLYVKSDDLKMAEIYYLELKKLHSNFSLDEFKIIDYATLLIKEGKTKTALDILERKAKTERIKGGRNLEMNCWKLLNAVAINGNPEETESILSLLIRLGYCKMSNILLGPQIRVHLLNGELSYAVEQFLRCAAKYRKTPLKHELLCLLVVGCNKDQVANASPSEEKAKDDVRNEYKRMLMDVQDCERKIHGSISANLSLISALADTGLSKPLRRFLLQPTLQLRHSDIYGQCVRFVDEKKLDALLILAHNLDGIRDIKLNAIYELVMKVHDINGDYQGALKSWNYMQSIKITPTENTIELLISMLKSHNQNIPLSLANYMKEETEASVNN